MRLLLLVVVVAAAGLALVWAIRRSTATKTAPPRVDPFGTDEARIDPRQIKVGDVVSIGGADFVVRGTLRFD